MSKWRLREFRTHSQEVVLLGLDPMAVGLKTAPLTLLASWFSSVQVSRHEGAPGWGGRGERERTVCQGRGSGRELTADPKPLQGPPQGEEAQDPSWQGRVKLVPAELCVGFLARK